MPGTMFQDLVSPHADSHGKWLTVPLSMAAHAAVLAVLLVAPLVATDVLPSPRVVMHYMMASVPPALPAFTPAPRRVRALPSPSRAHIAPIEAPIGIPAESGLDTTKESLITDFAGDIVDGLDISRMSPEQPPEAPARLAEPVRPGTQVKPPLRIKEVAPAYPEIARAARVQGVVIIEAIIAIDGSVQRAKVLRSIPLLDQAALDAVRSWEYAPTLLNGQPVPVIVTVTVQFRLN